MYHDYPPMTDEEKSIRGGAVKSADGDEVTAETHSVIESSYESSSFFDPNLDSEVESIEDDSPYVEVRAAVSNTDDPEMPCNTLRAWVLGLGFAVVISGANQFFYMRYPTVILAGLVTQLLVYPVGRLWARVVPRVSILGISLNPGPFTIKEHCLATVMAGIGSESAYANDIIAVQRTVYHSEFSFAYQWMLVMSTQLIGCSMGGMRRFLISPASMIWPNTLVSCSLFNLLHSNYGGYGASSSSSMSRERFFLYALVGAAVWGTLPGYLFQALSMFSWVCWIVPDNIKINQLFGYRSGLGFSILTFDWNQIAYIGSPLATPWWAEANILVGFLAIYWFLTPILYYANTWYSHYLPMSSNFAYDRFGGPYNAMRVLQRDPQFGWSTAGLNVTAYENYSPLFLPIPFAFSYGTSFMSISSLIVHTLLYFRKPIMARARKTSQEPLDIHARLMSVYPQVPGYWYFSVFVVSFVMACVCTQVWPSGLPVWALILALLISFLYVIPIGMVLAQTNRIVGLNVLTELIVGYMVPGNPNAMMNFKTFGYITMAQAMKFAANNKLGHYMKIPPRPMFVAQVVAAALSGTVQLVVQGWMFRNIDDLCHFDQKDGFICAGTQVFGTASIIWGLIGPARIFASGQIYFALSFFFIIGAACPLIAWMLAKRYPNSLIKYINFPLMFAGIGLIPPASGVNYIPFAVVGYIFQYWIRRRYFSFWARYNYILSAALDAGTAMGVILIYFALQYPTDSEGHPLVQLNYWGNRVFKETADWRNVALKNLEPGDTFGPETW